MQQIYEIFFLPDVAERKVLAEGFHISDSFLKLFYFIININTWFIVFYNFLFYFISFYLINNELMQIKSVFERLLW